MLRIRLYTEFAMTHVTKSLLLPMAHQCRRVASAVIAGPWPGKSEADVMAKLDSLTPRHQASLVSGVVLLLFLLSVFAAQFGLLGLAIYFLAVILIVS